MKVSVRRRIRLGSPKVAAAGTTDQFGIETPFAKRWDGHMQTAAKITTVGGGAAKTAT